MLKIPSVGSGTYEKVVTDEWIPGVIESIEYEENHDTGFKDPESGEPLIYNAVKLGFRLEGYEELHKTFWMKLSMHEKSNLAKKYLNALVENLDPSQEFDLERIKNMKVKVMYSQKGKYQNIEMVRPAGKKLDASLPF